jgi:hypothetical protein
MIINLKFDLQRVGAVYDKPIIKNMGNQLKPYCLIDTGANTPVWCRGEKDLKEYYPDCIKMDAIFIVSGFGTGKEIASVYKIPQFKLSDGKAQIVYNDMLIAVIKRDFAFHMIVSYTMLNKFNIGINTFSNKNMIHSLNPSFKIASYSGEYHMRPKYLDLSEYDNIENIEQYYKTDKILDSIYIFTQ